MFRLSLPPLPCASVEKTLRVSRSLGESHTGLFFGVFTTPRIQSGRRNGATSVTIKEARGGVEGLSGAGVGGTVSTVEGNVKAIN